MLSKTALKPPVLSLALVLVFFLGSCQPKLHHALTIVQINDTYETAPLNGGKSGGLARVATLYNNEKDKQAHTYMVHAGDFFSPSVHNSLKFEGQRLTGRPMTEVLNATGLNYMTFGNHEFDVKEIILLEHLSRSQFQWITANVSHKNLNDTASFYQNGKPLPPYVILQAPISKKDTFKLGMLAVTLTQYQKPHVFIKNPVEAALQQAKNITRNHTPHVVALTHLSITEDRLLARRVADIKLIMGGHEHEQIRVQESQAIITKAHANARSAWVHHFYTDKKGRTCDIRSKAIAITDSLTEEPQTKAVVDYWQNITDSLLRKQGLQPEAVVLKTNRMLDGREASVRNKPTELTKILVKNMALAVPEALVSVLNAGAIRIDDQISGIITEKNLVSMLPFGGEVEVVSVSGHIITKMYEAGQHNKGTGGYLHWYGIQDNGGKLLIDGQLIRPNQKYKLVTPAFLLTGKEKGMDFFVPANENIDIVAVSNPDTKDIRLLISSQMQKQDQ